jgi:hypothetical protein
MREVVKSLNLNHTFVANVSQSGFAPPIKGTRTKASIGSVILGLQAEDVSADVVELL